MCGGSGGAVSGGAAHHRAPFSKRAQATGLVQVASGGAAFAASLACHFDRCFAGFLAVGTWTGAFYAANGFLAVAAARTRLSQLAIGGMVLSLLATMLGLLAIGMAVVGILVESDLKRYVAGNADFQRDAFLAERCRDVDRRIFLHVVAVAAHATQILASSFQSVLAFKRYVFFEASVTSRPRNMAAALTATADGRKPSAASSSTVPARRQRPSDQPAALECIPLTSAAAVPEAPPNQQPGGPQQRSQSPPLVIKNAASRCHPTSSSENQQHQAPLHQYQQSSIHQWPHHLQHLQQQAQHPMMQHY